MSVIVATKQHPDVKVIVVEYDPETQEAIRTLESLNFDKTSPGLTCKPLIIKMNVTNVSKIKNIRLGLLKASQDPQAGGDRNTDQSVTEGVFGVEHSKIIENKSSLSSFFPGINTTDTPADPNNILVNNLSDNSSEYIYLSVKMTEAVERGYVGYKWFFDFI